MKINLPKLITYHIRGNFHGEKQTENDTHEEFCKRLNEIDEECNFDTISVAERFISKYMIAIADEKLRDKGIK